MSLFRLAPVLVLVWGAAPLAACDLDGLPGFHRANPFARAPIFRGTPAPPAPARSPDAGPQPDHTEAPPPPPAPPSWQHSDNPGPISPEDKALFS